MQKHLRFLATALVVAGFSGPLAAQETETLTADTVMATVNGEEITLGHMIAARATLDERFDNVPPQELYNGILEQLIQQTALAQSVPELPPLVALTLQNEERSLKAGEAIEKELQDAVSDEDIQAAYDAQFSDFEATEEYNASHILVPTKEEAEVIKEEIDGGADFAATAREKSTGPSGPNGGELGWFGPGMMVPSFEAATIALGVGEVSDPVETQFGWHVIRLNDARKTTAPSLDEVRDNLAGSLRNEAAREIINGAADNATVVIPEFENLDHSILTQREILEQ